jgi:hypothetical protein
VAVAFRPELVVDGCMTSWRIAGGTTVNRAVRGAPEPPVKAAVMAAVVLAVTPAGCPWRPSPCLKP